MTSTQLIVVEEEISNITSLLNTIPFAAGTGDGGEQFFLGIYKLSYEQLMALNNVNFPIDSNKLLKLGISLGNLLKTLQADEENEQQQQQQLQLQPPVGPPFHQEDEAATTPTRNSFMNNLRKVSSKQLPPTPTSNSQSSPFLSDFPPSPPPKPHVISSPVIEAGFAHNTSNHTNNANANAMNSGHGHYPLYHIKFLKNLLSILKNFDIGNNTNDTNGNNGNGNGVMSPTTPTTLHRVGSKNSSTTSLSTQTTIPSANNQSIANVSPIKLNSRQLLIEKLEININLDTLFTYKIIFKLLLQILNIIYENILKVNPPPTPSMGSGNNRRDSIAINSSIDETSSIFSTNSETNKQPSQSRRHSQQYHSGGGGEYSSVLNHCLSRVSHGIINPFKRFIFVELVDNNVQQDFDQLLTLLA